MAIKFTPNIPEVQMYLNSIRKYKVLTPEEETKLFKSYKETGDKSARDRIINSNQLIVFAEAKHRAQRESEIMDYVDEGNIGLSQAVDAFDLSKGFRFMTIAMWYVKRAMGSYKIDNAEVRQSNAGKYTAAVMKIKMKYIQDEHREPSLNELTEELSKLGLEVKDPRDLLDLTVKSSDDMMTDDPDGGSYGDSDEYLGKTACRNYWERIEKDEADSSAAADALSVLSQRERQIVCMAFGLGYDREYADIEIAEKLGLTNMRISQLRRGALKKMRAALAESENL